MSGFLTRNPAYPAVCHRAEHDRRQTPHAAMSQPAGSCARAAGTSAAEQGRAVMSTLLDPMGGSRTRQHLVIDGGGRGIAGGCGMGTRGTAAPATVSLGAGGAGLPVSSADGTTAGAGTDCQRDRHSDDVVLPLGCDSRREWRLRGRPAHHTAAGAPFTYLPSAHKKGGGLAQAEGAAIREAMRKTNTAARKRIREKKRKIQA